MDLALSTECSSLKPLPLKERGGTLYSSFLSVLMQFKITGGLMKNCLSFQISLEG